MLQRRFRPLPLLAGLLLAAFSSPAAQATFPGRNGIISVSYAFNCSRQIATLEPDGRPLRMITPPTCSQDAGMGYGRMLGRASWSPHGRRLIFSYEVRPYVPTTEPFRFAIMNANGSGRRDVPLVPGTIQPSGNWDFFREDPTFTPDGKRLLYTRHTWGPPAYPTEIWSARLDGGDDRWLASGGLARISPDGRRIAYVQSPRVADDGFNVKTGETWLMSARTGQPIRRLWGGSVRSLDWAPHGERVVFTSGPRGRFSPADVYVIGANGKGLRRATTTPNASETDAAWSPDGRRIAFVREVTRGSRITQAIWTMRADGTAERRIRGPWLRHDEDSKGDVKISWQPLPRR